MGDDLFTVSTVIMVAWAPLAYGWMALSIFPERSQRVMLFGAMTFLVTSVLAINQCVSSDMTRLLLLMGFVTAVTGVRMKYRTPPYGRRRGDQ